jgi:hypothetical protein
MGTDVSPRQRSAQFRLSLYSRAQNKRRRGGGSIENRRLHRPNVKNYTTEGETNFRKLISGGGGVILSTRVSTLVANLARR